MSSFNINKGDNIWFSTSKKPFRVRECNERFAICTQPYNFRPNTVVYTIIDFERNVRGMDNMIFGVYDYYSDEDCKLAMEDLLQGDMEVSWKSSKNVSLDIVRVDYKNKNINKQIKKMKEKSTVNRLIGELERAVNMNKFSKSHELLMEIIKTQNYFAIEYANYLVSTLG